MKYKIAVIGLGYVGLPLANAFSIKHDVLGYDCESERVKELNQGFDHTNQISTRDLKKTLQKITFSDRSDLLSNCNIYIITVPTPVNKKKALYQQKELCYKCPPKWFIGLARK